MSMITISQRGDFSKTLRFLRKLRDKKFAEKLDKYGKLGVDALREATPRRSGKTAESWTYRVEVSGSSATIYWSNTNQNGYFNVAVGIQYGHGTRTGGYVQGIDYINPAMRPIFEQIANEIWAEVISD